MSFASLLRHSAAIIRQEAVLDAGDPTYDERGQPITEPTTIEAEWRCRVEPKDAREVARLSQAGPVVADHTIYGLPTDLRTGDALLLTDGRYFEVHAVNDAGGHGHHLEVEAQRVAPSSHPALRVPTAPLSFSGVAGDTTVSLAWHAPNRGAPITGYRVYQDGVLVASSTGLSATITGLTNAHAYGFRVAAVNATGEGPKTSTITLTPVAVVVPPPTSGAVPYDAASPWNTPIGAAAIDPDSATWMAAVTDNGLPLTSDPDQYTIPVYAFDADTPLAPILINGFYSTYDAGDNSRVGHGTGSAQSIPIPAGTVPPDGSDGQVELLDPVAGIQYGFWQLVDNGDGSWQCENAYRYHTTAGYMGRFADGLAGRGAGTPYLAGLVRRWEVDQGHIDHALAFAYDSPSGEFVYPASKSDGGGFGGETGTDAPEGARLQLDPALTDTDFTGWGLSATAKIIAVALQTYGAYVIDHSGSSKLYIESRLTADWDVSIDRELVSGIPWSAFRFVVGP